MTEVNDDPISLTTVGVGVQLRAIEVAAGQRRERGADPTHAPAPDGALDGSANRRRGMAE
jgi:hypothetical protein